MCPFNNLPMKYVIFGTSMRSIVDIPVPAFEMLSLIIKAFDGVWEAYDTGRLGELVAHMKLI